MKKYFLRYYSEDVWFSVFKHIITSVEVVERSEIREEIPKWRGRIKEKDLENLATVKYLGLKYLVAFDEHYKGFEEYKTPKEFIESLGMKPSDTEY